MTKLFMYLIKHALSVQVPIDRAFTIAQDYSKRCEWDPFIKEYIIHTPELGLAKGFQVSVTSKQRMSMTVEYINYKEPEQVAMKMISKSRMFTKFSGYWSFESVEESDTKIVFGYQFMPRLFLRPFTFIIKRVLSYEMKSRLNALKEYLEN